MAQITVTCFKELMQDRRNTVLARQGLRKLLNGPILCTPVVRPDGRREYAIRGETKLGALLSSCVKPIGCSF